MSRKLAPEVVAEIIKLNEQGFTHIEIRGKLGIGTNSITRSLHKHHERVYEALAQSHVAERGRQLKWLMRMFRETWEEWERSKGKQTTQKVTREKPVGGDPKKGPGIERSEVQIKDGLGNPAYVDRCNAILGAIREVMMMDKTAKRDEQENPGAGDRDVTRALEELERIEQTMRGRAGTGTGTGTGKAKPDLDDDDADDTYDDEDDE
jgi:hypothetical protein